MSLEDTIRKRLEDAIAADTRGRRGKPRSVQVLADEAGIDADHLRKFLRGDSGMSLDKIASVANALGKEVAWVIGGSRQMSGISPNVPAVDSARYPVDALPDTMQQAIRSAAFGEAANLTDDPGAHWVRLQESFGDYKAGDWVLLSPSVLPTPNDDVGAVVDNMFVVGTVKRVHGEDCLLVPPRDFYGHGQFRVVGPVAYHLSKRLYR